MKRTPLTPWSVAPLLALCCLGYSQGMLPADAKGGPRKPPQGLRRLAGFPAETGGSVIPADAISIVDVVSPRVAGTVGRVASRWNIPYLGLPPKAEWSTPLRPLRAGANYTTFTLHASLDSVVSVDGALVSLVKSEYPGYATVMVGYREDQAIKWASLSNDVPVELYSGQPMGSLSMVTICTDTESRQWSIILCDRLAAFDLPLGPVEPGAPRLFSVKTGAAGAWVCGLASSDENPAFDDVNHNGIRDSFETKLLGAPLARHASREARDHLVNLWKQKFDLRPTDYALATQKAADGPVWENVPLTYFPDIPGPDPRPPEPDGRMVRGIPGSYIGPSRP